MSQNQDVLKVTIQFNKKKVILQEVGESALTTYQDVLDVFRNPTKAEVSEETEGETEKSQITDYA